MKRRQFLHHLSGIGAAAVLGMRTSRASAGTAVTKPIPATGEQVPVIGMGSSITFDVGDDPGARATRVDILWTFFDRGVAVIDSSPMYGSAEEVIGDCLSRLENDGALFAATKVWTPGKRLGELQMGRSYKLWGVDRFALMQVHNLIDWETHLETLQAMKAQGRIRYIGVTTSHGRRHRDLEMLMRQVPIDFVQFTYNIADREAEERLLPLAAERGIAVMINRPFRRGGLFDAVAGKALPDWAGEFDCRNWAQFFLKFIVSHPAVTCAIPATSRVDHMVENMGAGLGRLPDTDLRRRMVNHFDGL